MDIYATLAGQPILWSRALSWTTRIGVEPSQGAFVLRAEAAKKAWAAGKGLKPVELVLGERRVKGLVITGIGGAADHPDHLELQVADHRVLWSRYVISRRYNISRRSGDKRWVAGQLGSMPSLGEDIDWAIWSLKGRSVPWTNDQVLHDVLDRLRTAMQLHGWVWRLGVPPKIGGHVQDLTIRGQGDACVRQALGTVPQLALVVDDEGSVGFLDGRSKRDLHFIATLTPEAGPSLARIDDRSNMRPRSVIVRFTREIELRFRSVVEGSSGTVTRQPAGEAELELDNVVQNADPMLGDRVAGEHIELQEILDLWAALPRRTSAPELQVDVIRRLWRARGLMATYAAPLASIPADTDWARRIKALYSAFRQRYRVPRHWRDRILSWRPERAAIVDPETGHPMPSPVYTDYAIVWEHTPDFRQRSDEDLCAVNIEGYSDDLASAHPAEVYMDVVDHDQMIFSVRYDDGAWGGVAEIYPSLIDEDTIPRLTPSRFGGRRFVAIDQAGAMILAEGHRIATVITAVPAEGELYDVQIDAPPSAGPCYGPAVELLVDPTLATARFAWLDGAEARIKMAFGHGAGQPGKLDDCLLDGKALEDLSRAIADRYYAELADRGVGALVLPGWRPLLSPDGSIDSVTYSVDTDGHMSTTAQFGRPRPAPPLIDTVGAATRNLLFRLVRLE